MRFGPFGRKNLTAREMQSAVAVNGLKAVLGKCVSCSTHDLQMQSDFNSLALRLVHCRYKDPHCGHDDDDDDDIN